MAFVMTNSETAMGERYSDASLPANLPVGGDWKEREVCYDACSEQRNI